VHRERCIDLPKSFCFTLPPFCVVYLHYFHIVMIHEQGYCVWLDDVHTSKSDALQAHQYIDVITSGGKMTLNSE
jgi:hypothetical protein